MPNTSQEMIEYMQSKHGDEFDDNIAVQFLKSHGYKRTKHWEWIPPNGVNLQTMHQDDYLHMLYLIEEWDFGGLVENHPHS